MPLTPRIKTTPAIRSHPHHGIAFNVHCLALNGLSLPGAQSVQADVVSVPTEVGERDDLVVHQRGTQTELTHRQPPVSYMQSLFRLLCSARHQSASARLLARAGFTSLETGHPGRDQSQGSRPRSPQPTREQPRPKLRPRAKPLH